MNLEMPTDPWAKFQEWYADAQKTSLGDPTAMVISTVDAEGQPHSRVVLCKEIRSDGLVFFTNYQSGKGSDLAHRPKCALNFFWDPLYKQVRMTGSVEQVSAAESDAYWRSRSRDKQLSNYVSKQSQELSNREHMQKEIDKVDQQFAGVEIPRPAHWGGYLFRPSTIELWSGHKSRFHDRFLYTKVQNGWKAQRLYP